MAPLPETSMMVSRLWFRGSHLGGHRRLPAAETECACAAKPKRRPPGL